MPKTIVICSDGTGNSDTAKVKSNVKQLFDLAVQEGPDQVATYDNGVGTDPRQPGENPITYRLNHLSELCFGRGVAQNLLELYTYLIQHYSFRDTVYVHHTVDERMRAGDRRYTRKRLTRRSHRGGALQVIQLKEVVDSDVAPP